MYYEKINKFLEHFKDEDVIVIETMAVMYPLSDKTTLISFKDKSNDKLFEVLDRAKNTVVIFDRIDFFIDDWTQSGNYHVKFRNLLNKLSAISTKNNLIIFT